MDSEPVIGYKIEMSVLTKDDIGTKFWAKFLKNAQIIEFNSCNGYHLIKHLIRYHVSLDDFDHRFNWMVTVKYRDKNCFPIYINM